MEASLIFFGGGATDFFVEMSRFFQFRSNYNRIFGGRTPLISGVGDTEFLVEVLLILCIWN